MKNSVMEHINQSAHDTWNFVCSCEKCDGYFIKVRKLDVPVILAKLGFDIELTKAEWQEANHKLVSANKKKLVA